MSGRAASSVDRILRRVRSLTARSVRDRSGLFWIEGVRNFLQASHAGWRFEALVVSPVLLRQALARKLAHRLEADGVPRRCVSPEEFRTISGTRHASGIGAIVRQRWTTLDDAASREGLCWIVVESLGTAGNLGTILRTAEAVGGCGLICVGPRCDPFDPDVVRAGMGGLFGLSFVRATVDRLAAWADSNSVQLVGLSPEARPLWTDISPQQPIGLVIGGERKGLSPALRALCRTLVRLPMTGRADSLNVGVATGVMLYELVRQAERVANLARGTSETV